MCVCDVSSLPVGEEREREKEQLISFYRSSGIDPYRSVAINIFDNFCTIV